MSQNQPQQLTAKSVRGLYWVLVAGLVTIMGVFASLFYLKVAPMLRDDLGSLTIIATVMAAVALSSLSVGWLWARPKVPLRPPGVAPAGLWDDPNAGARAVLLWVLWEGGSMIATIGTVLTGSPLTAGVAALGLALLLSHSPGMLEERTG